MTNARSAWATQKVDEQPEQYSKSVLKQMINKTRDVEHLYV